MRYFVALVSRQQNNGLNLSVLLHLSNRPKLGIIF